MSHYRSLATKAYRQRVADILGLNVSHLDDAAFDCYLDAGNEPAYCAKALCLDGCYLGNRPRKLV